MQFIQIFR